MRVWLFGKNNNFWGGNQLKQRPLYAVKFHGVRIFENKSWLAVDLGYGNGARSEVNGELRDNRVSTFRFGATYSIPMGLNHSLKLTWISDLVLEKGADFDALSLNYVYRW